MKLIIEINEEIGKDFQKDRFSDFFGRLKADLNYGEVNLCGLYEMEIIEELEKAFGEGSIYDLGRWVEDDK